MVMQCPQRRQGRGEQSQLTPHTEAVEEAVEERQCQQSFSSALGETIQERLQGPWAVQGRFQKMTGYVALRLSREEHPRATPCSEEVDEAAAKQPNRCCLHRALGQTPEEQLQIQWATKHSPVRAGIG